MQICASEVKGSNTELVDALMRDLRSWDLPVQESRCREDVLDMMEGVKNFTVWATWSKSCYYVILSILYFLRCFGVLVPANGFPEWYLCSSH